MKPWLIKKWTFLSTKIQYFSFLVLLDVFLVDVSILLIAPEVIVLLIMMSLYKQLSSKTLDFSYVVASKHRPVMYVKLFLMASSYAFYMGENIIVF